MVYLAERLLHQIHMPQRKGISVHYHNAGRTLDPLRPKTGAVGLQSPAVFHQDGQRGLRQEPEAETGENRLVFRFGKQFQVVDTPQGRFPDEPGKKRSGKACLTGIGRHGNAFEDIPFETGAGKDIPFLASKCQIQIHFLQPQTIGGEETLHFCVEERRRKRYLLYVKIRVCLHFSRKHSNTPGSACYGIALRR